MKSFAVVVLLAFSVAAHAGKAVESCGTNVLVPGKGWVSKKVSCSELERPIPCTREWTDEKGRWNSEPIDCPAGAKQKTFEQVERDEEAAKEKTCGRDYGKLRVGMSLQRFEQCNEPLSLETETMTKDGRTEVYSSTFHWIQSRNGKIVSYTRRTN